MERKPHRTPARRWLSAILIGIACGIAAYLFIVNFTTAFSTAQCGLPPMDIQVMKLGPDGTVQWKSRIDSGEDDPAYEIVPVPDGGYVLSGRNDFRIHLPAARLIRLNSSGGVVWDRSYPEYQGAFHGLFPGPAGGVVTGAISPGKILVLDADGNVSREIPFAGYEYSSIIAPDTDGGCLVAGYADDVQELNYFRFDSSGRVVWNAMLGKSWDNRPILMAEIRPGTFEILYESARQSGPPPINILETFSATFDDNGTLVQQRMPDISPPMTKTSGQDYFAARFREKDAGSSYGYGTPHLIVRMREDGTFVWQTPVPSDWHAVIRIVPTRDGGCVVLGSSIQKSGVFSCSG